MLDTIKTSFYKLTLVFTIMFVSQGLYALTTYIDGGSRIAFSANGRFIAYIHMIREPVSPFRLQEHVSVRDQLLGTVRLIKLPDTFTNTQSNYLKNYPTVSISNDGQYIVFNLAATGAGGEGVFLHDMDTDETSFIATSHDLFGAQTQSVRTKSAISGDGRYIALVSHNALIVDDLNSKWDVYIYDQQTDELSIVSTDSGGTQGNGNSSQPVFSTDGRYIAFSSYADNLVSGDNNSGSDIFIHDRQTSETTRVSVASNGAEGNSHSRSPAISADGRYVAFSSTANNLVTGDSNMAEDIFIHDRQTGQTSRISIASDGTEGNLGSEAPVISDDGRFVAFTSDANNLVIGDSNLFEDIFIHDRQTAETISTSTDIERRISDVGRPVLSPDGRFLAFGAFIKDLNTIERDSLVFNFGTENGLWRLLTYNGSNGWAQLHSMSPLQMTTGDIDGNSLSEVLVDFGDELGTWMWANDSNWLHLHSFSPELMKTGDIDGNGQDDALMDFGPAWGVWTWMNNEVWLQLHTLSVEAMTTGDIDGNGKEDAIMDFGSSWGVWVWMNNEQWLQIHSLSVESVTTGDIDGNGQQDALMDFGPAWGVWAWMNNHQWSQIHSLSVERMTTGDIDGNGEEDALMDFGPVWGIWVWLNNNRWVQLHTLTSEGIETEDIDNNGKDDVMLDFGAQWGVWVWMNNQVWVQLHVLSPEQMVTGEVNGL